MDDGDIEYSLPFDYSAGEIGVGGVRGGAGRAVGGGGGAEDVLRADETVWTGWNGSRRRAWYIPAVQGGSAAEVGCEGGGSWVIIYENKTEGREMVVTSWVRDVVTWYGCSLSAWSILVNVIVIVVMLAGVRPRRNVMIPSKRHDGRDVVRHGVDDGGVVSGSRLLDVMASTPWRWLTINFSVVQLAICAFIIPVNVITDKHRGWMFGGTLCRVWLMMQLLLVAETLWSMFMMTFDQFLRTVSPVVYWRWSGGWKTALLEVTLSWSIAALVLLPTLVSHSRPDFILEEVCAASMSPEHTLFVTLSVFVVPATLTVIVSLAIAFAKLRGTIPNQSFHAEVLSAPSTASTTTSSYSPSSSSSSHHAEVKGSERKLIIPENYRFHPANDCRKSLFGGEGGGKVQGYYCTPDNPYGTMRSEEGGGDRLSSTTSCSIGDSEPEIVLITGKQGHNGSHKEQRKEIGSNLAAMTVVNVTCMITWAPFYATSVLVVFCEGRLCVNPVVWSLMIWIGYTTAGLAPLFWFLDPSVRKQARRVLLPCWGRRRAAEPLTEVKKGGGGHSCCPETCDKEELRGAGRSWEQLGGGGLNGVMRGRDVGVKGVENDWRFGGGVSGEEYFVYDPRSRYSAVSDDNNYTSLRK